MFSKMRKALRKQEGFTLIELMTVLIILGVILGIGVPKYIEVQKKAKFDADVSSLQSMAKLAETYVVTWPEGFTWPAADSTVNVTVGNLVTKKLIDEEDLLYSLKDNYKDTYTDDDARKAALKTITFTINKNGQVTNVNVENKAGDVIFDWAYMASTYMPAS